MAWLHKRSIAANATVTINFDASYTGTESGTIAIAHPDAARVVIAGNATSTNISTCTAATGSIGARSLTYTVASATGLAVGDSVVIEELTCANPQTTDSYGAHSGYFTISAISGTSVTVTNYLPTRGAISATGFGTAKMTKITQVKTTCSIDKTSGLTIGNVAFVKNGNTQNILINNSKVVISGILTALNTSTNNFIVEINNSAIGSPTHVRAAVQRSPVHIVAE